MPCVKSTCQVEGILAASEHPRVIAPCQRASQRNLADVRVSFLDATPSFTEALLMSATSDKTIAERNP